MHKIGNVGKGDVLSTASGGFVRPLARGGFLFLFLFLSVDVRTGGMEEEARAEDDDDDNDDDDDDDDAGTWCMEMYS